MYLIAGLGNPGKEYAETRHNIGFWVIYELAKKHNIQVSGIKHRALIGQGMIHGKKIILAQPQTFMNLSGEAIQPLLNYYRIPLENFIVVYDDLDLDPGKLRMRKTGGAGGHKGIISIIDCLGTREFTRLRVGIGRPPENIPGRNYVLGHFDQEEKKIMEAAIKRSVVGIELWLSEGVEKAMNQVNRDVE